MSTYIKLAKHAVEHYVRTETTAPVPPALPSEAMRQRACYVFIYENPGRRLRSMAGYPLPRHGTLAEEIIANTVEAVSGSAGRRVRRPDLQYLAYRVALLGPLQRVSDPEHLNPQRYGLYVKSTSDKSSLLLPQRIGIETADDQIATAIREARIDPQQEVTTMYRFDVVNYDE